MQKSGPSNHEITTNKAKEDFLTYEQNKMIEKFSLEHDEEYLYINFVAKPYRIDRKTGDVDELDKDGNFVKRCGFSETLSIFDVLCYSKDDCHLAGSFCTVNSLKGIAYTAGPGSGMFDRNAALLDGHEDVLEEFCQSLGGRKVSGGDVSYEIPIYDFLPAIIRFWASDDEFPADIKFYWDENILMYMHFETVFFVMGFIYGRIREFAAKRGISLSEEK